MAVKKLVELDPTPFLLIDVRHPDAAQKEPKLFEIVINIPGTTILEALVVILLEKS